LSSARAPGAGWLQAVMALSLKGPDVTPEKTSLHSTGTSPETLGHSALVARLASPDGLMPASRKQLEVLEDWVKLQLARQQQQSELLVERTLRRMEARTQVLENEHPKLEMGLAQHGGGLKGLADEFEAQALRMDALETRQYEWRQSVEESLRARLGDLERQLKNCATNCWRSCVDNENRLLADERRLQVLEERTGGTDLGAARMAQLEEHATCMSREVDRLDQVLQAFDPGRMAAQQEAEWEQRAMHMSAKIDPLWRELGNMQELAQEQEVRLGTLHVSLVTQETRTQVLMDRFEAIDMNGYLPHGPRTGVTGDTMLKAAVAPKDLFGERPTTSIQPGVVKAQAEQWLHSEDEPVRNLGVLSPRLVSPVDAGRRELQGLCETMRTEVSEEEGDQEISS